MRRILPVPIQLLATLAAGFLLLTPGCGYPAAEPDNLELITSLRTALSARNEQWLQANEDRINQRHAEQQMSDTTHAAFQQIIAQARAGEWREAELQTLKFQRAQRPTAEQVAHGRKLPHRD